MKCKKCGKEVKKSDAFCQYCGTKVEVKEAVTKPVKTAPKKEEVKQETVKKTPVVNQGNKGLAIASMVLGIIGLIMSLIVGPFAFIFPLLGLIFAICSKSKLGFKTAGLITSIIGFVIGFIYLILMIFYTTLFASIFGEIIDNHDYDDFIDDYDIKEKYDYKYATPYGEWTCEPYPSYSYTSNEKTTLNLKYDGTLIYGPTDDLDNNYYKASWTYKREYDKNEQYTDREFVKITAPVTEFKMNGISQDTSNKNLNLEMEFINDYDEAIIMFDNTSNTYKCTK